MIFLRRNSYSVLCFTGDQVISGNKHVYTLVFSFYISLGRLQRLPNGFAGYNLTVALSRHLANFDVPCKKSFEIYPLTLQFYLLKPSLTLYLHKHWFTNKMCHHFDMNNFIQSQIVLGVEAKIYPTSLNWWDGRWHHDSPPYNVAENI